MHFAPLVNLTQKAWASWIFHHPVPSSIPATVLSPPGQGMRLKDQGNLFPWAQHHLSASLPRPLPSPFPTPISCSAPQSPSQPPHPFSNQSSRPLCTAARNYGAFVRKKLCRAGSCPFPHFSSAGIDPHLHPGSRVGRRNRLSAEEGVGQIIWQLMEKGVLGTFTYLKNILSKKSTTGFFASPPPFSLPPPWGCPLPPLHKEPSPTWLAL